MSPVLLGNGKTRRADRQGRRWRPNADSGAGALIQGGFTSTLSLAYLIGALLCCFIGSLVTEKRDLIVKIKKFCFNSPNIQLLRSLSAL